MAAEFEDLDIALPSSGLRTRCARNLRLSVTDRKRASEDSYSELLSLFADDPHRPVSQMSSHRVQLDGSTGVFP